jgi:D-amino-acid dehydrogenase
MQKETVCVLGAGIVGLATAYELNRQGFRVIVVDRASLQEGVGSGASGGNGGQLSYSYVQPLADESIWRQLLKLLLSRNSPLKVRLQLDSNQWRWAFQFMQACNARTAADTTAKLLVLAALSRSGFERLMSENPIDCDFASNGKLVLYPTQTSFAAAQRQMALQSRLGSQQKAVTAQACCDLEPALVDYRGQISGAIFTPSECAVDCWKLCRGLETLLRQRGVKFLLGTKISNFETNLAGKITKAIGWSKQDPTQRIAIEANTFVLALGSDSPRLAKSVGLHLPVYPIKGYSVTFNIEGLALSLAPDTPKTPKVNVTDSSRKVVFARLGSRLRVAGMAELIGHNQHIDKRAIDSLKRSTSAVFPQLKDLPSERPWAGLRPATPTGLPIVGTQANGPSNLIMNTGHGALGLTLAFGTAQQVADICRRLPSR